MDERDDFIVVVAFGDVVESTLLNGPHPAGDIAVGGQQDDFRSGRGFPKLFYQIDPISVGQNLTSQRMTSKVFPLSICNPDLASAASSTAKPSARMMRANRERSLSSSSITSILCKGGVFKEFLYSKSESITLALQN